MKDKKKTALMDLEKAYNRFDREALWNVLKIFGVEGQLLAGVKAFYRKASAYMRVDGELSKTFPIGVGLRRCVMSSWLFNISLWMSV